MGALFGSLAALAIGLSDFFGRRIVERIGESAAVALLQLIATAFSIAAALLVIDSEFVGRDIGLGAVSGVGLMVGLTCYYGGLTRSSSTVVAPVVATLSAVIPLAYATVRGDDLRILAAIGAAIAIAGLLCITAGGEVRERVQTGLWWGLASGVGYGFGLSALIDTTEASGAWPAASQRLVAFVLAALLTWTSGRRITTEQLRQVSRGAAVAGFLVALTTIVFILGVQADAGPAVVTTSMFPAVSVIVGYVFFRDPVSRLQVGGIGLVLLGVAAVVGA